MKLSYYPGCTMKNHAGNFEASLLYSMKHLGVEVKELDRWNCCGTVLSLAEDDAMRQLAASRCSNAKPSRCSSIRQGSMRSSHR